MILVHLKIPKDKDFLSRINETKKNKNIGHLSLKTVHRLQTGQKIEDFGKIQPVSSRLRLFRENEFKENSNKLTVRSPA